MGRWNYLFIIVLLGLIQVALVDAVKFATVRPDLIIIGVVVASLSFELPYVLILCLSAGILKDIFSPYTFGINVFILPLLGFLIVRLSKDLSWDNSWVRAMLISAVSLSYHLIVRSVLFFWGHFIPVGIFLRIALLESLYTALISVLVFKYINPRIFMKRTY